MNMLRHLLLTTICLCCVTWSPARLSAEEGATRVLIVVGPSNHAPGTHEVAAGGRLIEHCLENAVNLDGIDAEVIYEWPEECVHAGGSDDDRFHGRPLSARRDG